VPTDGQLDICLVDPVSRLRALRLLPALITGKHVEQPEVRFLRTRRMVVESHDLQEIWADGERIACTPATIEVIPAAVQVLCPRAGTTEGRSHPRGRP
jgi:diacylglycerol kinase (ATP)